MKDLKGLNLGVALCGSFCTFSKSLKIIEELVQMGVNVFPIMSFNAFSTSTRFTPAADFIAKLESLTQRPVIHTIVDAEPLGPKNMIDAMLIMPCTGNTLAKLNYSIIDTPVLLAAKSLLRNNKPIVICLASNDGIGGNLKNIGMMMDKKSVYFVPLGQDDIINKPNSLVANFEKAPETLSYALSHQQIQPVFFSY